MSDDGKAGLRERLARLYLDREYDEGDSYVELIGAHPDVQKACYEFADAMLVEMAVWLRDEAERSLLLGAPVSARRMRELAATLDPKETDR
jgi:hypothetical protein